jgi:beta-lactamase superfamily II metal-dependent hydrolase
MVVFARLILLTAMAVAAFAESTASKSLDIYWIDVEGGAATLIVAPSGQSLLIDTGWAVGDRDAMRIYAAAQQAGLKKIDHLIISHFHADHVGGLAALSKMIPIDHFYGRGNEIEKENQPWLDSFVRASMGRRTIVKPGDTIPIPGVHVLIVASDGNLLSKPLKGGGTNPLCATTEEKAPAGPENQRMVGTLLTFGKFRFVALIDLDWEKEMELVCPINKLGRVTIYQTSRHGSFDDAGSPALLGAIRPQVVVMNNGPRKGMGQTDATKSTTAPGKSVAPYERNAYLRLARTPGVEDVWQSHLSLLDPDPHHNTAEQRIANLEETAVCKGNWIKASVAPDGRFKVTNGRNGYSKSYVVR